MSIDDLFDESKSSGGIENEIRYAIGRNQIKYEVLNKKLLRESYDTIHINLNGILKFLSKSVLSKCEKHYDDFSKPIISGIINLASHYRHYFAKLKNNPKIYIYTYTDFQSPSVNKAVNWLFESTIINYLPGIYLIPVTRKIDTSVVIKYFINKEDSHALVITKEICDLQLIDALTDIIYSNKDKSKFYGSKNIYNLFTEVSEDKEKFHLSSDLIGPILFFSGEGLKNSGVKSYGKSKTVRLFEKFVKNGSISNIVYTSYDDLCKDLRKELPNEDFTNFESNFNLHDLNSNYIKYMTVSKSTILDNYIIDKFANKSLKQLNNEFFTGEDSLNLSWLMEFKE